MAHRNLSQRVLDDALASDTVGLLQVVAQGRVIAVEPNHTPCHLAPRQIAQHGDAMGKVVHRDGTGKPRIVVEDQLDVFGRALVLAPLVDVHAREPVLGLVVIMPLYRGELLPCLGQSLLADGHLDARIGSGELLHRPIARQASRGCPRLRLLVKLPELMDANEVKGVDELAAARVGRVVAVEVLTVLVNHGSCSARACCIGVAVICGAGVVRPG